MKNILLILTIFIATAAYTQEDHPESIFKSSKVIKMEDGDTTSKNIEAVITITDNRLLVLDWPNKKNNTKYLLDVKNTKQNNEKSVSYVCSGSNNKFLLTIKKYKKEPYMFIFNKRENKRIIFYAECLHLDQALEEIF